MYSCNDTLSGGLPHSDIHGSTPARGSPWLFAACHVLHRLLVPRHPPNALIALDTHATTSVAHHAQKQNISQLTADRLQITAAVIANLFSSGKHVYSLSTSHNASERMLPRSRRPAHRCTSTSGQTWLTAARPETHQNLIHTLNDRDARTRPLARANAPNGNIKPRHRRIKCAELLSSPWFAQSRSQHHRQRRLVEANGIEPMTSCLQSRRSPS